MQSHDFKCNAILFCKVIVLGCSLISPKMLTTIIQNSRIETDIETKGKTIN